LAEVVREGVETQGFLAFLQFGEDQKVARDTKWGMGGMFVPIIVPPLQLLSVLCHASMPCCGHVLVNDILA